MTGICKTKSKDSDLVVNVLNFSEESKLNEPSFKVRCRWFQSSATEEDIFCDLFCKKLVTNEVSKELGLYIEMFGV